MYHLIANFNRASLSYDSVASVQEVCARKLIDKLKQHFPDFYPDAILDLGTGTGCVPQVLLETFPKSHYTLTDRAIKMLQMAKEKLSAHGNIRYTLNDIEKDKFGFYPLITSNFVFQWAQDLYSLLKKFYQTSEVLAFSCLLQGTFDEWASLFRSLSLPVPTYKYPSLDELKKYMLALSPKGSSRKCFFDTQQFTLDFEHPAAFMRYLKSLGANQASHTIALGDLRRLVRAYSARGHSHFSVTYNVFFGVLG